MSISRNCRECCGFQAWQPGVVISLLLLLAALPAASQVVGVVPMYKDHRAVLISGFATGSPDGSSISSISLNGVDFTLDALSPTETSRYEMGSPLGTCQRLREQISTFTLGANTIPEFEAACMALAGDAALLLVQANTEKYLVPSEEAEDDETARWIKMKRRLVFVSVSTTDQTQKLKIIK